MSALFDILDCCGEIQATGRMQLSSQAMIAMKAQYASLYHNAVKGVVFGSDNGINKLGNLNFLMVYLDIISEIEQDSGLTKEALLAKYCIKKIEHAFRCIGIDIRPALSSYNLYPYTSSNDGIDYMIIEGTVSPINRVRDAN